MGTSRLIGEMKNSQPSKCKVLSNSMFCSVAFFFSFTFVQASSRNIIRVTKLSRTRWAEHVARMGEWKRGLYRIFVGTPEGEMPLGRPRHRWEDNIKMDIEDVG